MSAFGDLPSSNENLQAQQSQPGYGGPTTEAEIRATMQDLTKAAMNPGGFQGGLDAIRAGLYKQLRSKEAEEDRQRRLASYTFDPRTGSMQGPNTLPGADIAADVQARQDQAMREMQIRKLQDATRMEMGALGLLQSYRPGGGAALEANVYGRAAGSLRAETAAMLPLDLMYNARKEDADAARRAANRASRRGMFGNIIGGIATVAGAIIGGPGGAAAGAAIGKGLTGGYGQTTATGGFAAGLEPETGPAGASGPAGAPGPAGPADGPGAGVGAPGTLGVGLDAPGATGDFTPASFASAAARSYDDPAMGAVMSMAMNEAIADMYDSDPFFPAMTAAVNNLLLQE
jgi:hypothetical protein